MANTINAAKTHCDHGHEFNDENTGRDKDGHRFCLACARNRTRLAMARRREALRQERQRKDAKRILGLPETFWARVIITEAGFETPCLLWIGTRNRRGYGVLKINRRQYYAHRFGFEAQRGEIAQGTARPVLDHLCRNHACVNVDHLELVTDRVNVLRGVSFAAVNHLKTHCVNGHEFTPENTRIEPTGDRTCRECKRIRGRIYDAHRRGRRSS